jgi:GAF domain-containing protein/HAMP domain-containing protein
MTSNRIIPRFLNPISWPMWLKLLSGFLIALVLPALLVAFFLVNGVRDLGLQTVQSFLAQNEAQQRAAIEATLRQSRTELDDFVNNPSYRRQLESLFIGNVESNLLLSTVNPDIESVGELLNDTLLDSGVSLFEAVRLLDRYGGLILEAHPGQPLNTLSGIDESESLVFRSAQRGSSNGTNQVLVISDRPDLPGRPVRAEIANPIYWRDGEPLGYLIATLDSQRVFFDNLQYSDNFFGAYSYLLTNGGLLLAPETNADLAYATTRTSIVSEAAFGREGSDLFTIPGQEGEFAGFYSNLSYTDTPLILISQVPLEAALQRALEYLSVRTFVVAVGAVFLLIVLVVLFNQLVTPPLVRLRKAVQAMQGGNYTEGVPANVLQRGDEIGALAESFEGMRQRVSEVIAGLEARVDERVRDLKTTQEVSRAASSQTDLQSLLDFCTNLIVERFPKIYHAQVFLVEADGQHAALRSSTGEVGRQMLARGHRLAVGGMSVIGQVTRQGQVIAVRDTVTSQIHRRNEFLLETRAELALPLRIGREVIGALDVQSKRPNAFDDEEIAAFQMIANQLSLAVDNMRLQEQSNYRLMEVERANRLSTLKVWQEYMNDRRARELTTIAGTMSVIPDVETLRQTAISEGRIVIGDMTERLTVPVAVPIRLRGQTLGAVEWELVAQELDENKLQLAQELTDRLAISLDNARLFQESQTSSERERIINSIASRLTAQNDINTILETAVREVGQALRVPQVSIRLHAAEDEHSNANGSNSSVANGSAVSNGVSNGAVNN